MAKLTLPVGRTDFIRIRNSGNYYIDKTMHISQIVRDGSDSILFTRPRRFGKTTFQSMLRAFFDIREDNRDLFTGLAIMDDKEAVEGWMNKWPVIHLTFKDIDGPGFSSAMGWMNTQIRDLYKSYSFLDDGKLDGDGAMFRNILANKASVDDICQSLRLLVELLHDHYGKKVIIILDEYDVPLDKAEKNGYYTEMLDVMRAMLLSVLKDCPYTHKGILTGCLRVSKESLFTGLNNLAVYSVTSGKYSSLFGFTEEEVARLLKDTGLEDKAPVVRQWYDGYSIGGVSLYSPWDVVSYVDILLADRDAEPENYWTNSSGSEVVRRLIDMTDARVGKEYSTLINGEAIRKHVVETLTYGNLYSSAENIWSLLFMTGYLTLAGKWKPNGETELRLPNEEVRSLFARCVDEWFRDRVRTSDRKELFEALWTCDADALSRIISQYLFRTISYYDYKEDYYHAFLAGLLSDDDYLVESNRESGTGRADIIVQDEDRCRAAVIEVKRAHSRDEMDKMADLALAQLKDREYGSDLEGYSKVVGYGQPMQGRTQLPDAEQCWTLLDKS